MSEASTAVPKMLALGGGVVSMLWIGTGWRMLWMFRGIAVPVAAADACCCCCWITNGLTIVCIPVTVGEAAKDEAGAGGGEANSGLAVRLELTEDDPPNAPP